MIALAVRGPRGARLELDAVLDTGFSEAFTLPIQTIQALELPQVNIDRIVLADGRVVRVEIYEVTIIWNGQERAVLVHRMESTPLIGMALIYHHLLTIQAEDHGAVTIVPLQ